MTSSLTKIPLEQWFNPHDDQHLQAYIHVCKMGWWPENFIPDHVEVDAMWSIKVAALMGNAWLKEKTGYDAGAKS